MFQQKKEHPKEKSELHARNKHRERYNFEQLIESCSELKPYVKLNNFDDLSIDFFNPEAVKMLNKALLKHFYDIENWNIPQNYLCPPIPSRADYIHYVADILTNSNNGNKIKCLDIGVGANCVYPIIGIKEYDWNFVGSEIDKIAIQSANKIVETNEILKGKVEIRFQNNSKNIFAGIIQKDEFFDITICNPPFHSSLAEAQAGTIRKLNNLTKEKPTKAILNFGGKNNELWSEGGEIRFVSDIIRESKTFAKSCFWFTTLISKKENLKSVYYELQKAEAVEVKTIQMSQGNKISRIVAWTFLSKEEQENWKNLRNI